MLEGEIPLSSCAFPGVHSAVLEEAVKVATGLCLVICVGPKLLPLLDCVYFGGLVCHLHKKLTA